MAVIIRGEKKSAKKLTSLNKKDKWCVFSHFATWELGGCMRYGQRNSIRWAKRLNEQNWGNFLCTRLTEKQKNRKTEKQKERKKNRH